MSEPPVDIYKKNKTKEEIRLLQEYFTRPVDVSELVNKAHQKRIEELQRDIEEARHELELARIKAETKDLKKGIRRSPASNPATEANWRTILQGKINSIQELDAYKERLKKESPDLFNNPEIQRILETQRMLILKERAR